MSRFIFASMGVRNDIIREKLSSKLDIKTCTYHTLCGIK